MRILLVEDDELLGDGLVAGLKQHGYTVDWVKDGQTALQSILEEEFAAVILDIGLPKLSGFEVLKRIRKENINVPVMVLTAMDEIKDIVMGLDTGADDYLVKPFDLDELCARVRVLLRRKGSGAERATPVIKYKDITLDTSSRKAYKGEQAIEISRREFTLLHILLSNPGRVLTRDHLTKSLYGWGDDVDSNALEVHIHNLRKKFGNELIATVRGVGYVIEKQSS
jgi:two-component system, OmpR family, response regulator QseB